MYARFYAIFLPTFNANTNAHNQVDDLLKPSVAQFCDACTNITLAGTCIRALPKAHNRWRTPKKSTEDPYLYIVESSLGYLHPLFCLSSILQPCRHICPNLPSLTCHRSATVSHPNDFELQSDSRNSYFLKDLLQRILQTPDISSSSHRAVHTATSQIVAGGPAEGGVIVVAELQGGEA